MRLAFVGSLVCASLVTAATASAAATTTSAGGAQVKTVATPITTRVFVRGPGCGTIHLQGLGDATATACHFGSAGSAAMVAYRGTPEKSVSHSMTFTALMDALFPKLVSASQSNSIIPTATMTIGAKTYTMTHVTVGGISTLGQSNQAQYYTATLNFQTITST